MGDLERQEKFYREAAAADRRSGSSLFKLALAKRRTAPARALEIVDEAIERECDAPYLVLRAELHEALKDLPGKEQDLREALRAFGPVTALKDWELHWYTRACRMAREETLRTAAVAEQRNRAGKGQTDGTPEVLPPEGLLPDVAPALARPN